MEDYCKTNIRIDDKNEFSLSTLYLELNSMGTNFHQNSDNSKRKESHYFLGESSVVVSEYEKRANVKIISKDEIYLNHHKSKIEKILEESRSKEI